MIIDSDLKAEGEKSLFASKTINFNWISGVAIPAIWPFLPASWRDHNYAIPALTAYFSIANILLRLVTKTAIRFIFRKRKK